MVRIGRRAFLGTGAAIIASACGGPQRRGASAPFRVVDTMPAFFSFWERAERRPIEEQRALLRELVIERYPHVYEPNVLGLEDAGALDARIARFLPKLPRIVPVMRRIHRQFQARLERGTRRFMEALPSFSWDGECYVMASIDSFNGAGRDVNGHAALLFGLDVIADTQADRNVMVLIHHELFHFHQALGEPLVYAALWFEGLATYASMQLNPGTDEEEALPITHLHDPDDPVLDSPERRTTFREAMPEHAQTLANDLLAVLDSPEERDYATFFLGRASPALGSRPVRSGYWLGLRVVQRLARGRSLEELAEIEASSIRANIERALREIARESA